jgi:hypothetical protein
MNRAGKVTDKSRAGNGDEVILQRLAHHLQDVALKFRQLIEEQHTVVPQRNFSGARDHPSADQSRIADGVVG